MARVLVAEDEDIMRSILCRGLAHDGHQVLEASNGRECLTATQLHRPDLLVLDIEMPGPDGLEVRGNLRDDTVFRALPIVFITARQSSPDVISGLEQDGDDYLTKPFDIRVLCARVRALLRRSEDPVTDSHDDAEDKAVLWRGPFKIDQRRRLVYVEDRQVDLTPTELSLFRFLLLNEGEVFSSEELLQSVWEYPYGIGEKATVRVCIKNLRDKIEPGGGPPRWIVTRPRHGYTIQIGEAG
ncbi:MAG TPA: DNA-binding response regulator [Armatimonadetes bacterium]|nr:DNA-binding response regulator [Armatimonadota bacterium]